MDHGPRSYQEVIIVRRWLHIGNLVWGKGERSGLVPAVITFVVARAPDYGLQMCVNGSDL